LSNLKFELRFDNFLKVVKSPYQPMEVLTAVVYDASLIHPTAYYRLPPESKIPKPGKC